MGKAVFRAGRIFADSIFPRVCMVCGRVCDYSEPGVCKSCMESLDFTGEITCLRCGKEIDSAEAEFCTDCMDRQWSLDSNTALLNYDGTSSVIMAGLKYKNKREYASSIAELIYIKKGSRIRSLKADCIIPVPLHADRMRSRGYNQAELIAVELGKLFKIPVRTDILYRKLRTEALKTMSPESRRKSLRDAFECETDMKLPDTVLLADDIYTTGSTMESCALALKSAGAVKVYGISACIGRGM